MKFVRDKSEEKEIFKRYVEIFDETLTLCDLEEIKEFLLIPETYESLFICVVGGFINIYAYEE